MSASETAAVPRRRLPAWLKEPLLHFIVLAGLLATAWHFFGRPEVKISAQLLNGMRKEFEASVNRPATTAEVAKLADDHLESEILYREALKANLTQDNRVRGLLIQTMRTSLRPIVPPPSDADLIALRAETPDIFRYPREVSFEHVSFAEAKNIPDGLLEKLRGGLSPANIGDQIRLANPMPPTYRPQLEYFFGPEFTKSLVECREGVWEGPFTSVRGVHFVRVIKNNPEREMALSEVRPTLLAKWNARKEAEEISRKVAEMKKSYRISMPPAQP